MKSNSLARKRIKSDKDTKACSYEDLLKEQEPSVQADILFNLYFAAENNEKSNDANYITDSLTKYLLLDILETW